MTYDTWLEQPYHDNEYDSDYYDECIHDLAEDYMRVNFKELDNVVMGEAIHELTVNNYDTLEDYLSQRDYEAFGRKIWALYQERCENIAEEYAKDYIERNGLE